MLDIVLGVVFTAAGIVGGYWFAKHAGRRTREKQAAKHRELIRSVAARTEPRIFVPPMCRVTVPDGHRVCSTRREIEDYLSAFLASDRSIMLVTGEYGTGKTVLTQFLAAQVASLPEGKKSSLPIYVRSDRITSDAVMSEIAREVSELTALELDLRDVAQTLAAHRTVVFFDALDQLPYRPGAKNRLDAILDFAQDQCGGGPNGWKAVLVVRDEFVQFTREFGDFIADMRVPHLSVLGFPGEAKTQHFLEAYDPEHALRRAEVLNSLLDRKPDLASLFERPVVLGQFCDITLADLEKVSGTATTIADVFRLSFADLEVETSLLLQDLAFQMFVNDEYVVHLRSAALSEDLPPDIAPRASAIATQTGLIEVDRRLCQFRHASFRDFFVALKYARAIQDGEVGVLGRRQNNYLVSEFVAGLLTTPMLLDMLAVRAKTKSLVVRINVMDILSELERDELKQIARDYFAKELQRVGKGSMDEYRVGLYTNSGILGFAEPINELIAHIDGIGVERFLEEFFPTKDNFAYYDHSRKHCVLEWVNILRQQKYGETRRLMAFLLGRMGAEEARGVLQTVREDDGAVATLRQQSAESLADLEWRETDRRPT